MKFNETTHDRFARLCRRASNHDQAMRLYNWVDHLDEPEPYWALAQDTVNRFMPGTVPVFVYGSLRQGMGNHHLMRGAQFIAQTQTADALFEMRSCGPFPVVHRHGHDTIKGELYRVDDHALARLDRLEGHPRWYRRELIDLADGHGRAWIYFMQDIDQRQPIVPDGDWPAFYNNPRIVA